MRSLCLFGFLFKKSERNLCREESEYPVLSSRVADQPNALRLALCALRCAPRAKRRLLTSRQLGRAKTEWPAAVGVAAEGSTVEQQQKIVKTSRNSRAEFPFCIELRRRALRGNSYLFNIFCEKDVQDVQRIRGLTV